MRLNTVVIVLILLLVSIGAMSGLGAETGKLVGIKILGSKRFSEDQIAAATGLKVGETVHREDLQAAADHLAQLGLFSSVRYRFSSKGDNVELEFQVEDAPTV